MEEQKVVATPVEEQAPEAQPSQAEAPQPQPTSTEEELRKLQGTKDREIAQLRNQLMAENRQLQQDLAELRHRQVEATIQAIEDPDERANAKLQFKEAELARKEAFIEAKGDAAARPVVTAILSQRYGVPPEILAEARNALEMENIALKYKLDHTGKELEEVKKKASKPGPPAAASQKFAQGAGQAPSSYDPQRFKSTGDIAGSLRAKREAGL